MKFLIQTIDGRLRFDFQLELLNAIDAHNFFHPDDKISYIMGEFSERFNNPKDLCPVGSVEFVKEYFKIHFGKKCIPKPKNVPKELMDNTFTKRFIDNIVVNDAFRKANQTFSMDLYVKSNDDIKSDLNGIYRNGFQNIPDGNFQVSKLLSGFKSEFRCFVFENQLLDVRLYNGDYKIIPDFKKIEGMIEVYGKSAPHAYTLDIGVTEENETVIIEVHDFFSCGLYGFMPVNKLPYMFWRWYFHYVNSL